MSMRERQKIQKLPREIAGEYRALFFVCAFLISSSWAGAGNRTRVKVQSISPTQRVFTFSVGRDDILALSGKRDRVSPIRQLFTALGNITYTVARQNPVSIPLDAPVPDLTDTSEGLQSTVVTRPSDRSGTNGVMLKELGIMRGEKLYSLTVQPCDYNPAARRLTYYRTITVNLNSTEPFPSNFDSPKGDSRRKEINKARSSSALTNSFAIRLIVRQDGIYHVTGKGLDSAGVDISRFSSDNLTLWNRGKQIPIYVHVPSGSRFTDDGYIEFYGTENRVDYSRGRPDMYLDPFTCDNVYFLTNDSVARPQRFATESGALNRYGNATDLAGYSFTQAAHVEQDNTFSRLTLVDQDQPYDKRDHWFWTEVSSGQMVSLPFYLAYPDTTSIKPLTFTAAFHGITFGDGGVPAPLNEHQAEMFVNQSHLVNTSWNGQTLHVVDAGTNANIPQKALHHGANSLRIYNSNPGNVSTASFAFNWVEFRYQRLYIADKDYLEFSAPDNALPGYCNFLIQHFQDPSISVYRISGSRITDITIRNLRGSGLARGYAAQFQAYVQSSDDRFVAFSASAKLKPASIERVRNASLASHDYSADYIIVTSRKLDDISNDKVDPSNPVNRLASWYDSHGTKTLVVDAAEVYDDFNYGMKSPRAIKNFVSYAYHNWSVTPKHVLLAGSGTWNTKSSADSLNLVPVMMVQTYGFGATASDNFYACVDGDDPIPDIAVGRIPASTVSEMSTVVDKILSYYNNTGFGWQNTALLVAGEEEEFHVQTDSIVNSMLPAGLFVKRLYTSIQDPAEDTKYYGSTQDLIGGLNEGTVLVNYVGHGGGAIWADNGILTNNEVAGLSNSGKYPFVASMTCFVGAFDGQAGHPLASTLLFAKGKGAIGVVASSGLGWMYNDFFFDGELLPVIFDSATADNSVGWDIALAKAYYYGSYFLWPQSIGMVNQYNLIGDPALRLQLPGNTMALRLDSYSVEAGQDISGTISKGTAGSSGTVQITNLGGDALARTNVSLDGNGSGRFKIPRPEGLSGVGRVKAYVFNASTQSASSIDFSAGGPLAEIRSVGITSDGSRFRVSVAATAGDAAALSSLTFIGKVYPGGSIKTDHSVVSLSVPLSPSASNEYSATLTMGSDSLRPGYLIVGALEARFSDGSTFNSGEVTYTVPGAADLSAFPRQGLANVNPTIKVVADSVVRLEATAYDWNSVAATDVRVDFYDGPRGTGKFLGNTRVSFDTTAKAAARIPASLSPGRHSVYMYLVLDSLTMGYDMDPENNYSSAEIIVNYAAADPSGIVRMDSSASLSGALPGEVFRIERTSPSLYPQPLVFAAKPKGKEAEFFSVASLDGDRSATYTVSLITTDPDSTTSANLSALHLYAYDPRTRTLNLVGGSYSQGSVSGEVGRLGLFVAAFSADQTPPKVTVSVGDQFFSNGDYVPPNPLFSFLIHDEDGVNINTGSIRMELDGQPVDPGLVTLPDTVINPTFITANLHLPVETGSHTLRATASDANGNVSDPVSVSFTVRPDFSLRIYGAYPNPFIDRTFVAFEITSGKAIEAVEVKVYSVSGRLIRTIRYPSGNPNEAIGLLQGGTGAPTAVGYHEAWWDGTDNYGNQVANGVYFYKVRVSSGGKALEETGKMARLR